MIYKLAKALLLALSLSSCASIFTGTSQDISVNTPGCPSAQCTLANSEGNWSIDKTPGTVTVTKDSTTLVIECKTKDSEPDFLLTWALELLTGIQKTIST